MTSPALALAKQQLRTFVRECLKSVPEESIVSQSKTLFDTLMDFPPYVEASRISIFLSMPHSEVQTQEIVRHSLQSGKMVFIPYLHKTPPHLDVDVKRVMDMVHIRDLKDYESLQPDKWGIPSLDPQTVHTRNRVLGDAVEPVDLSSLDLVLVPGLAFDSNPAGGIKRMGHGRGFYDLFLDRYASLSPRPPLALYGLGLTEQYLPNLSPRHELPTGHQDKILDGLILGNGSIIQ
ncbi:hypothetical protein TD95_004562 [Thielaviopsis punctulata]|uniref:5-formyltetrahydrofolate cyclo-ligase n=1 Tax=Thielaviopsis punctulata TaxID=72032 RepID=A0A0F4ZHR2_9PEZI|nr:hypothetical protein TD95_004562 [Thielaviopsis punctulata]